MNDPTILIVPPQNLSAKDKRDLAKIGVVVIEMDNPQDARLIRASAEVSTTDMLAAAAQTIMESKSQTSTHAARFAELVCTLLVKPPSPPPQEEPR